MTLAKDHEGCISANRARVAAVLPGRYFRQMASQRDKERMARIGAFMDQLNRQALVEAGQRTPGENLEIGLPLGDFARGAAQAEPPEKVKVPLVRIWRAMQARKQSNQ